MDDITGQVVTFKGVKYDYGKLSSEGQRVLTLLLEAQTALARLETRTALLQAAQAQLITQLQPLLPEPINKQPDHPTGILGVASKEIPSTPVEEPKEQPAALPQKIPDDIRA